MTARGRSCFRLADSTVASCVAMLKEERTVRAISALLDRFEFINSPKEVG